MQPRIKKLIGLAVFLPTLTAYFFAAAALGEHVPDHQLFKVGYYVIAGIAWAFPAKFLIAWMNAVPGGAQDGPNRD